MRSVALHAASWPDVDALSDTSTQQQLALFHQDCHIQVSAIHMKDDEATMQSHGGMQGNP